MSNSSRTTSSNSGLTTGAYVLAAVCLVVGIALGYLVRGGPAPSPATNQAGAAGSETPAMPQGMGQGQVTPEQLKHMADKQAEPMLAQLKASPNDPALLANIGNVYYDAQQFQQAIEYYTRSLEKAPDNLDVRTDMGTAYYYSGSADQALAEFDKVLKVKPTHPNALFNQGIVRWGAKMDVGGAVASWDKLLKTNPDYAGRAQVEQMMAKVKQHMNIKPGTRTEKPAKM